MKLIAAALFALLALLQYRLWSADGGMREVWYLEGEITAQQEENDSLAVRNRALIAEVQDLKQGKTAVEERARTDLGMIGPRETFFQVVLPTTTDSSGQRPEGSEQ